MATSEERAKAEAKAREEAEAKAREESEAKAREENDAEATNTSSTKPVTYIVNGVEVDPNGVPIADKK